MATQEEQFDSYPHQEALTFEQKRWLDNFETNYDGFTDYRGQGTVTITQGVGESNIYFDEPAVWIDVGQKVRFTLADDVDESEDWQVGEAMETTDKFLVDPVEGGEFSHTFESEGVYMYQNGYNVRDGAFGFIVVGRPA